MKRDYQNILLATDFSRFSENAAKQAMNIASYCNETKLTFMHVVDEDYYDEFDSVFSRLATDNSDTGNLRRDDLLEYAREQMVVFVNKLEANDVHTEVVKGLPRKAILSYAKKKNVDLIVMGAHGRHGLARLLGSTTNNVMNNAKCDVLAVYLREEMERH